ncbi:MAG: hypothetical protein GX559_01740 [Candidatus Pacebacteria bacterium]|nr:hypothetical protein [Candidatus Paceibacterota bacterium]
MMKKLNSVLYSKRIKEIAQKGEALLKDLPHLPKDWVKNIVKVLPILVLVFGVASVFSGVENLLSYSRRSFLTEWIGIGRSYYYVNAAFAILIGALYLMSHKLIKNKEYEAWLLLFWTGIVSVAHSLVLLVLGWGGIWSSLISAVITFYFLYEIRAEFVAAKNPKVSESKPKPKKSKK